MDRDQFSLLRDKERAGRKSLRSYLLSALFILFWLGGFYYIMLRPASQPISPLQEPAALSSPLLTPVTTPSTFDSPTTNSPGADFSFPFWAPFVFIILALALGEDLAGSRWMPFYFRYGLPIFARRYDVVATYNLSAFVQSLLGTQGKHSPVSYRLLNEAESLFREQPARRGGRKNWSVHGRIRHRTLEGELYVQGYLDWSLVIFVLILLGFLFLPISPLPMFPFPNFIYWQKVGAIIGLGFMFFYVLRARRLCDQIGRYFSQ